MGHMTEAFSWFIKQASSQGREYGDGFNSSHFKDLTAAELEQAFLMLRERALDGDTIAIDSMRFFDKKDALNVLDMVLNKASKLSQKALNQAAYEAYKITGNIKYLMDMVGHLNSMSAQERWHCIQLLCSIEYGKDWVGGARSVFEAIVLDEQDDVLRHSAAKRILLESGVIEGTLVYKDKISRLINSDRNVRESVLSGLGAKE
jgi:hypothetical protein